MVVLGLRNGKFFGTIFVLFFVLHNLPWAIIGDFNDVLNGSKKLGGNPVNLRRTMAYSNCMNIYNMIDLGFSGPIFPWTNCREIFALIEQRIDRFWANPSWNLAFPEANVTHWPRKSSNPRLVDKTC